MCASRLCAAAGGDVSRSPHIPTLVKEGCPQAPFCVTLGEFPPFLHPTSRFLHTELRTLHDDVRNAPGKVVRVVLMHRPSPV